MIERVQFLLDGCIHTSACCNIVARLVEVCTRAEAWQITLERMAAVLETLPRDHFHCAELTVGCLHHALQQSEM